MPIVKIFLFGIDNAGKTALSMTIKNEKVVNLAPTTAFNISKWVIKALEFAVWDAPGQIKYREEWIDGLDQAQVLMFVLDTTDAARFDESKRELDRILNDQQAARVPLVFCFHKMDLPEAKANHAKAQEVFKLSEIRNRKVYSFDTSIKNPESLNPVKDALVFIIFHISRLEPKK
nr:ADP-ribosylation factor-like protein [Candidatus Sigynarchaeota archaeon]